MIRYPFYFRYIFFPIFFLNLFQISFILVVMRENNRLDIPLTEVTFTVLDTETTGVDPADGHGIIELGMVHFTNGTVSDHYSTLIQPTVPQTDEALSVHRIEPRELKKAPLFKEIADEIIDYISDTVIAAHNLHFDMMFIDTSLDRIGRPPLKNLAIDTISLSQEIWPEHSCHCLRCLGPALALSSSGTHRALEDVISTAGVLENVIAELNRQGKNRLRDLHPVRKDFTWETGELYRKLMLRLKCAVKKQHPVKLLIYHKDDCFYSLLTVRPEKVGRNHLYAVNTETGEELAVPFYNIIRVSGSGSDGLLSLRGS